MAFVWHNEGKEMVNRVLLQEAGGAWAVPANYYLGLCNEVMAAVDDLADISTELAVALGYARVAIPSSAVGWPTIVPDGDYSKATSQEVSFTSVGGAWATVTRGFLCTVASGTGGKLLASFDIASYALPSGDSWPMTVALSNKGG